MPMNNRTMRPKKAAAAVVTYNAEALAWKTAAEANGGTVTTSTLAAVSTFCDAIDAAGIRSKFLRVNLFCGDNLAAARTPLYRGASSGGSQYGNTTDTNNGPFVSADYSESTGLNGNGTSKYLDTGLTLNTAYTFGCEYNNVHLTVYRRDDGGTGADVGVADYTAFGDVGPGLIMYPKSPVFQCGDDAGEYQLSGTRITNTWGMFLGQSLSGDGVFLQNDTSILSDTRFNYPNSYSGNTSYSLFVFALNSNGSTAGYSSGHIAGYSVGKAFTSTAQRTAYYNAMQNFQTAMGRQA